MPPDIYLEILPLLLEEVLQRIGRIGHSQKRAQHEQQTLELHCGECRYAGNVVAWFKTTVRKQSLGDALPATTGFDDVQHNTDPLVRNSLATIAVRYHTQDLCDE